MLQALTAWPHEHTKLQTDETDKRYKGTSFKPVDWALKLLLRIIVMVAAVLLQR